MSFVARRSIGLGVAALAACARDVVPARPDAGAMECPVGTMALRADFAGPSLGTEWNTSAVGTPPAYVFDGGWLEITDAAFAIAPSSPDHRSWIYDPRTDLGNQMSWDQPIGTGDFAVSFDLDWSSTVPELTLAGVGVTDADDRLEVFGGFTDPWDTQLGSPFARVTQASGTSDWSGAIAQNGQGTLQFVRRDGEVRVTYDGATVMHATNRADVRHVAIFAVRHLDTRGVYDFGSFGLRALRVCF